MSFVFSVQVCAECGEQVTTGALAGAACACGGEAVTWVRFRVDRSQLLKQVKPEQSLAERTVYFGCWRQAGHYYWLHGMRKAAGFAVHYEGLTPWGVHVDGGLLRDGSGEGIAHTFHKDGWTALAFEDRSVDHRGGSISVFCIPDTLGWHDALRIAQRAFPEVFARYTFPIVQGDPLEGAQPPPYGVCAECRAPLFVAVKPSHVKLAGTAAVTVSLACPNGHDQPRT